MLKSPSPWDALRGEANRLLQAGGANELYCKNRRDAIVIFAISHGYTLQKTEEELYRFGEATIS